ncbi:MAG TPA: hypothetical protein VIC07_03095 [Acidimicrobiia bacterium]|jgi:hypothetical protein
MLDRVWWFVTGVIAGGWVTVRALRRRPTAGEWRDAAIAGGADLLDLAARAVRPSRPRREASGAR